MNADLLICRNCGRELPNYHHFTKNGCQWCDEEYHKGKCDGLCDNCEHCKRKKK